MVGAGTTFRTSAWTDGIVLPVLLEIDGSRWEVGAFRFATVQYLKESFVPPSKVGAPAYWGFAALRRWQVLHRSRWKLYLGFGVSYQTRTDLIDSTRWNFAYVVAIRHTLGPNAFLELDVRHWSNAGIRMPNRGQNILMLGIGWR